MGRKVVYQLLQRMDKGGYSSILLDNAITDKTASDGDKAFITTLFYGVLERRLTLDHVIGKLASSNPAPGVRTLLQMGLYELMYLGGAKPHATVSQTVELAPQRAKGFVNAVLRNFLRAKEDLLDGAPLSVQYSCPEWLIQKWRTEYGEEYGEQSLMQILSTSLLPALAFQRGGYLQDESSYQACLLLAPQSGETVLDLCAAPGGKSFTMAKLMNNTGRIIACDINRKKLDFVAKRAKQLELSIIETTENDAKVYNPQLPQADRVLCDVPCSGLGVIRRKPEIKYKPQSEFAGLPQIQLEILSTGSRYVKAGGALMYSTCTLSRAENDEVIERFLSTAKDFELIQKRTTIPTENGGDGFFAGLMRRV